MTHLNQVLEAQVGRFFFWRLELEGWNLYLGHCSAVAPSGFLEYLLMILSTLVS